MLRLPVRYGPMSSAWESRDLPVLKAIVELTDEGEDGLPSARIADRTGLDEDTVQRALWALAAEHPPFFTVVDGSSLAGRYILEVNSPTGHARRTVGSWPSPETIAAGLIAALQEAAEHETSDERKGRLRRAADALGGLGKDVLSEVIASVITKGIG
jgi:hypothetical protein